MKNTAFKKSEMQEELVKNKLLNMSKFNKHLLYKASILIMTNVEDIQIR